MVNKILRSLFGSERASAIPPVPRKSAWETRNDDRDAALRALVGDTLSLEEWALFEQVMPSVFGLGGFRSETEDKPIKATSDAERNGLFRTLMRDRDTCGYTDILAKVDVNKVFGPGPRSDDPKAEVLAAMSCETVLLKLAEYGFAVEDATAGAALRFLADTPVDFVRQSIVHDFAKMVLLGQLARAYPAGAGLPDDTGAGFDALKRRISEYFPGEEMAKLHERAQVHRPARNAITLLGFTTLSLLERHSNRHQPRIGAADPNGDFAAILPDLERYQVATYQIMDELRAASGLPDWSTSPEAYAAQFGDASKIGAGFGWWDIPKDKAGSDFFQRRLLDRIADIPAPEERGDAAAELRTLLDADESGLTPLFSTDTIPDAQLFAFDGADSDGAFLDRLVTAEAAKPTAAWRKTARAHIARIGPKRVCASANFAACQFGAECVLCEH